MPILQFVHIVEGGDRAKMSKRAGDFVTLTELIERHRRRRHALVHAQPLARLDDRPRPRARLRRRTNENPVYYVQYAHARLSSILRNLEAGEVDAALASDATATGLNDADRELVRRVLAFPGEVREATERRAPHRIATYALELAHAFSAFWRDSPVTKEPDAELRAFRVALSVGTRRTLASALTLLGVSSPESM